jgi:hypothetical protein
MKKILTPKEAREIVERITPEQWIPIETEILALFGQHKRSQLKLIRGGRGKPNGDSEWLSISPGLAPDVAATSTS